MNTAPPSVTSDAEPALPSLKRRRKASALFRKLSLKAAKNWHQKSGAKRRDVMSERNIVCFLPSLAPVYLAKPARDIA